MPRPNAAWGMEIGSNAIKAVRLERDGDQVTVSDFAVIPHRKVLTTPDLDQDEMVRLSLGQFISQKTLEGEHLVMSVPGHAAFARFAKLPPVEPKKVPDIVKFEAVQQIPFPIDEVEWDYETFTSDDSPEIEVGIFAITRERVQQRLGLYAELGVSPEALTLSPVALYNAMSYDLQLTKNSDPIVFLDVGTNATDVVIADRGRCWIRTFPLGGTHFTEAIASAFKLSYTKAEKLKHEASTSKYAKQIMQAMRPVFSDLLQDLQRSIGYFQSLNRDRELSTMIGVGSTFKIPGLRKFIGQQLQMNVMRLDEFKRIAVTGRQAASFSENTVNMATAYGLALQGVGLAPIDANLVPVKTLREQMWHAKTKWFAAAAAIVVLGAATMLYHPLTARGDLQPGGPPTEVEAALRMGNNIKKEFTEAQQAANVGFTAENMRRLTDYRMVWPYLVKDVADALHSADPQPVLLSNDRAAIREVDPEQRRVILLEDLTARYAYYAEENSRRLRMTMLVQLSHESPDFFLNDTIRTWLREHAEPVGDRADVPYRIIPESISLNLPSREEIVVTEEGEQTVRSGNLQGSDSGSSNRPSPPGPGSRKPPGPSGASGFGGSSGTVGASGGTGSGGRRARRTNSGPPRQAPGPGSKGGVAGSGSGQPAWTPPSPGSGSGTGRPSMPGSNRGAGDGGAHADLDELAPLESRPSIYPPGTRYYRVPITFDIEILVNDQHAQTPPADQVSHDQRGGREKEARS
jgi:type IV pilus assembly protein PilM